ncbi:hypothetical protein [Sporosarcina limicola]|uniref:Uncharacterized protein YutE (UPF0331/DUF86 family) n=1 Tax=Sporosarcina limicola TaxID=34101 RepID=A0A927MLR6_9BACL|nr:hypothetical protein [Sporosarcina limicola]MBE1556288.1 uncharacterized protein YutE (UPF0331/DUF86 family) [Sporosarcina limicola]
MSEQGNAICKDINHSKIFDGEVSDNVFKYRLILILQEAATIKWGYEDYYLRVDNPDELDEYFLYRYTLIKIDSIMDAVENLNDFYPAQFTELDRHSNDQFSNLLYEYKKDNFESVAELRNTIHYDDNKNFYDYFLEIETYIDFRYILALNKKLFTIINSFLKIESIPETSLNDLYSGWLSDRE